MSNHLIEAVTMPFSLCKLVCTLCLKTIFIVIQTWMELIKAAVLFHVNMFWKAVNGTVALISLPLRLLTALHRETLLEQHVREMQFELETLVWERKELQDHLHATVRERRIMESVLMELEQEHDKAIAKIELLEGQLQDLKDENLRLKEIQGKAAAWGFKGDEASTKKSKTGTVAADLNHGTDAIPAYSISPWNNSNNKLGISFQDLMISSKEVCKSNTAAGGLMLDLLKAGSAPSGLLMRPNLDVNAVVEQRRETALSQTLFSAILSLVVGMIVWEAEDPCMPLVVALFTVVGMSLKSVIQFFFSIKNKPASDAVALLSFNWFILGTLSYPTLPRVTRMLAPLAFTLVDHLATCLGIS